MDEHIRRTRMLAALIMVATSGSIGFFGGRMSTWLVPVESKPSAAAIRPGKSEPANPRAVKAVKSKLGEKTRAAPSRPVGVIEAAIGGPKASETPPLSGGSATVALRAAQDVLTGMDIGGLPQAAVSAATTQPPSSRDPVVINAGSSAKGYRAADIGAPLVILPQEVDKTDDGTMQQCERRYSSFRQSDGTYQPFDGGPRRRCPLLR